MIVEFSVKNFRSINTLQTISFVATGLKSAELFNEVDVSNIVNNDSQRLLKTVGIYGANGSGKSNMIAALHYFLGTIKREASTTSGLGHLSDPFLYQESPEESESFFQIVLILRGKKFRYGFTVKPGRHGMEEEVTNEWLFGTGEKNMTAYFIREGAKTKPGKIMNSDKIPSNLPYPHSLYLVHAAAFDSSNVCALIRSFLKGRTMSNFSNETVNFRRHSFRMIESEPHKEALLHLLSTFNLKFSDVAIQEDRDFEKDRYYTLDRIDLWKTVSIGNKQQKIKLNLTKTESAGTQKLFELAGFLVSIFSMAYGGLLILDEIDSNFHPSLLVRFVSLFNDPILNNNHTQLLFSSHDTNLLSPAIMRRDQFYFAEKQEDDSTRLYSLADLRGIRNDADFAKDYLAGIYGGTPILQKYVNEITAEEANGALEI